MRKLMLAFWAGVLLSGSAYAQQPTSAEPWANKLFVGGVIKDFGTVAKGAQLKHTFRLTNIYKVPLEITGVRPSCGCVTWNYAKSVMQPGESIDFNINMNTGVINGSKSVIVSVSVGPQFISVAELTVKATTRQDVVFNPGEIQFGVVQRGSTPSQVIDVEYAGALAWRVSEIVKNANAPFDLKVEELTRQAGAVQRIGYRIYATLKADATPGTFKEEILLKTNDPVTPVLTFNILGNVQAPLTAAPNMVSMTSLKVGITEEYKVVIRGGQPFRITRIDGLGQGVFAAADDRNTTTHILTIRCQLDQPGEVLKTLVVHTSLENETVQIVVEAKAAP